MDIREPPIYEMNVRGASNKYSGNGPQSGDTEYALDMQVASSGSITYSSLMNCFESCNYHL